MSITLQLKKSYCCKIVVKGPVLSENLFLLRNSVNCTTGNLKEYWGSKDGSPLNLEESEMKACRLKAALLVESLQRQNKGKFAENSHSERNSDSRKSQKVQFQGKRTLARN